MSDELIEVVETTAKLLRSGDLDEFEREALATALETAVDKALNIEWPPRAIEKAVKGGE